MDVVERGYTSLKKACKHWHIPLTFFSNNLNGITKSRKQGPQGMVNKEEDATMEAWTLGMKKCGFSITLDQLKMKVAKFTQTKINPFKCGNHGNIWWYWFMHCRLELSIRMAKGLDVCRTQGLTSESCNSFYQNLQILYI
jgi:hypothetical protein